jgi:hypothetical protein
MKLVSEQLQSYHIDHLVVKFLRRIEELESFMQSRCQHENSHKSLAGAATRFC